MRKGYKPEWESKSEERITRIRNRTAGFSEEKGRRPRILITRIHPSETDRVVKTIATAFADMGFDVDINTAVQSPANIARMAAENDVHAVGFAGITVKSKNLISALLKALEENGAADILVAVWTSVQPVNCDTGFSIGSHKLEIFGIETDATVSASRILDSLERRQ
jgi:methylmalonyl-CoA mutase